MNIIIFEDSSVTDLYPFTVNHASFEIKIGRLSNIERIFSVISPNDKVFLYVRDEIESLVKDRYPQQIVNSEIVPPGKIINGSSVWTKEIYDSLDVNQIYSSNGKLVALNIENSLNRKDLHNLILKSLDVTRNININHISYLWDAISFIPNCISMDCSIVSEFKNNLDSSVIQLKEENIYVSNSSVILPGCIIDASCGPVIIDDNSMVDIGSLIKGPVYIGKNVIVNPGTKLRGNVSIGNHSKVGGELSNVIFQGYSNKQHDGFLGNSFVGEWVNLGANTNNSNLKNNYSNVKVKLGSDKLIDTHQKFIGSFIGDYTRTGISTMLNTGTVIGFGANIFGGDFQKKEIDSFAWGNEDRVELNKFLFTCQMMKERRNESISDSERSFIIELYDKNN